MAGFIAAAAAFSAVLVPATAAMAAPAPLNIDMVEESFDLAGNAPFQVGVACPAGSRMVSSGAGNVQILGIVPNQDFTAVQVYGVTGPAPVFMFVQLQCAPIRQFADVVIVRTNFPGQTGIFRRGVSRCPAGKYAFGGSGYFLGADGQTKGAAFNNVSNTPSADGTGWTFAGVAPVSSDQLVVVEQCAPKVGRDILVQTGYPVDTANTGDGRNGIVGGYSTCPSGFFPISGGYYISNPDGSEATPGNVTYSEATNRGTSPLNSWFVSGTAAVGKKVVALVQCVI